jgi:hypothetical protein
MPERKPSSKEENMQGHMHWPMGHELRHATRLDVKIVVIAIVVTLIFFTIAMAFAESTTGAIASGLFGMSTDNVVNVASVIIMFVAIFAAAAVTCFSVYTILTNKAQRAKLNQDLAKFFADKRAGQNYDGSIFKASEMRYDLFAIILSCVGAVSVIAPLVVFIDKLVNL